MSESNLLVDWLVETFKRFSAKSPKYFQWLSAISAIVVAVTSLPSLLESYHIAVPAFLQVLSNPTVGWVGLGMFIVSKLTAASTPVVVTKEGDVLSKPNGKKLPFSTNVEKVKAENDSVDKGNVVKDKDVQVQ